MGLVSELWGKEACTSWGRCSRAIVLGLVVLLGGGVGSCGLDEYHELKAPAFRITYPTTNTTDELLKSYSFRTAGNSSSGDFVYEGTAVYYKIYNNLSSLQSHNNAIDNLNKEESADAAVKKLIDDYKYQPLGTSRGGKTPSVLFGSSLDNKAIDIRLHDYHEYKRHISIDGIEQGYYPMRHGDLKSFHFNPTSGNKVDVVPANGDEDVVYDSPTKSGTWYVNAFAFARGHNAQYTNVHSLVLHLGALTINESDFK